MPTKPLQPCRQPGCAALVPRGYCDAHAKAALSRKTFEQANTAAAQLRRSTAWKKVSELFRARFPVCCDPHGDHQGLPEPTQQTHHIVAVEYDPALALTEDNLAPVCTRCHAKLNWMERNKQPTAHLFEKWKATYTSRY